jgi:hypothetical protein
LEAVEGQVPEQGEGPDDVLEGVRRMSFPRGDSTDLVEEITVHFSDTLIGPSSVNKEQLRQEPELPKGVVGRHRSLRAFKTK